MSAKAGAGGGPAGLAPAATRRSRPIARSPLLARLLPVLGVGALAAAPFVLDPFHLGLLGQFLCFGIAAMGLDLLWGYGGMMSLAQGTFFSLGAYCMAMYLKLAASGGSLPDFMVWNGVSQLPGFWYPFHHFAFALAAALLVPGLLGGFVGLLIFRQRVRGVYFAILTQAFAVVLTTLFIGEQGMLGGFNGLTNFTSLFGIQLASTRGVLDLYAASALAAICAYAVCRALVTGRFGRLLIAIRDGENRVRYLGYDPAVFKAFTFGLACALAGLGGALYVGQIGIISPAAMGVVPSIEIVVLVAVGGRGTIAGAIIGAVLVKFLENGLNSLFPGGWQYLLGALFILTVVAFPRGIAGVAADVGRLWRRVAPTGAAESGRGMGV